MFGLRQRARKGDIRATRALNLLQGLEVDKKSLSTHLIDMYKNNDLVAEKIYNNIGKSLNIKSK
jgi:DNA polymerase I-like protein with 3'-5' exonuclease and polymerase domains